MKLQAFELNLNWRTRELKLLICHSSLKDLSDETKALEETIIILKNKLIPCPEAQAVLAEQHLARKRLPSCKHFKKSLKQEFIPLQDFSWQTSILSSIVFRNGKENEQAQQENKELELEVWAE